jgi:hypothetical protein
MLQLSLFNNSKNEFLELSIIFNKKTTFVIIKIYSLLIPKIKTGYVNPLSNFLNFNFTFFLFYIDLFDRPLINYQYEVT